MIGKEVVRISGCGHLGDGNIHLSIAAKEFTDEMHKKLEPFVFEFTSKQKGSVSAEHGIGIQKPKYMHFSKSEAAISVMHQIKEMMDPKGILNPYKVLPDKN